MSILTKLVDYEATIVPAQRAQIKTARITEETIRERLSIGRLLEDSLP